MKLSAETLLATAQLQIELLNNQLEEERRRAGALQEELEALKAARRGEDAAKRQAPSFFDRESDGQAA